MALISASASSEQRIPKAFAIRSFPPLCGITASPTALPPTSASLTSDQNVHPANLTNLPPEPTSCGPGNDFIFYRGKIFKRPIVFAIRSFPKGCGSLATATPKLSRSKQASSIVVAKEITMEGSGLSKLREDVMVGGSLDEKDPQKPNRKSSQIPNFTEGDTGLSKNEIDEMEKKLNDVVKRITEEASGLEKVLDTAVVGRSLGEKVGEKPIRKSSTGFSKDERRLSFDSKKELNEVARRVPGERSGSGKIAEKAEVGRFFAKKDGRKPDKKHSLTPNLVEGSKCQSGQTIQVLGDRLVVLALMASKRCPWMQSKRKGSVGLQSSKKKPRVRGNDN